MRKQQKAQLNQLASSSSSLLQTNKQIVALKTLQPGLRLVSPNLTSLL